MNNEKVVIALRKRQPEFLEYVMRGKKGFEIERCMGETVCNLKAS